jgi:phage portal protein BeeE
MRVVPRQVREARSLHVMRSGSTSLRVNASPDFLSEATRIPIPAWGFDDFAVWWEAGGASQLPAVGRAVGMIADPLASVPWRVVRGREQLDSPLWIRDPQNAQRDRRVRATVTGALPGPAFWMDVIYAVVLHGNALLYTPNRDPLTGYPLAPLFRVPSGTFAWDPGSGGWQVGDERLGVDVVLHFCGKPPYTRHGLGVGVLERYAHAFDLGAALDRYAASTFRTGVPTGYLKVAAQATADQLRKLKADWLEAQNTADGRTIAVLGQMVDFQPITIKPTDADLVKVSDLVLRGIAHAFGLSAHDLDVQGTSDTYANVQDRQMQRRQDSLLPWARLIESTVETCLPAGQQLVIGLDGLERGNTSQRLADYRQALDGGFMTVDEVRESEGRPPMPAAPVTVEEVPGV